MKDSEISPERRSMEKKYHYEVRFFRRGKQVSKSSIVDTLEEAKQRAVELCGRGEKASIYRCKVKDWEYCS